MNNIQLKEYVDDALETLASLAIDFIAIIENLEAMQKDATFLRSKFNRTQSSFDEFNFIDNILVENLSTNILSVIDPKQDNEAPRMDKEISNYDILKLAVNISGRENTLNAKTIKISEIKEIHKKIDFEKLNEIKKIRDQHYSHIDRKRKNETNLKVSDTIEIVKSFLEMFDLICKSIKGKSIYDIPINIQLFDLKLKAFKYDMIMKYLNEDKNIELDKMKSLQLQDNFKDSYYTLFK